MNNLALCLHSQLLADHCILLLYTVIHISLKNYLWELEKMFNVKSKIWVIWKTVVQILYPGIHGLKSWSARTGRGPAKLLKKRTGSNHGPRKNWKRGPIGGPWIPDHTRVVDSRNDLLEYSIYFIMTKKTFLYQKWTWCEYWFKWFSSVRNHSKFFSRLTLFGHREVSLSIDYLTDYP